MFYGRYRIVRDDAWQCLSDFGITEFPVNVSRIAREAGICLLKNSCYHSLKENELARIFDDGTTHILLYDDTRDRNLMRFVVAHELGHYFLGHHTEQAKYINCEEHHKRPTFEVQADMFAMRLLCPACVLHALEVKSKEEIMELCVVPEDVAENRYKRMLVLNKRNKFLTSPLEQKVYEQFESYISNVKAQRLNSSPENLQSK